MDDLSYTLPQSTLDHLADLVGTTWDCLGSPNMVIDDLITCPILLATERTTVALSVMDNEVSLGMDFFTLTKVHEVEPNGDLDRAKRSGSILIDGQGERVTSIALIREELTQVGGGEDRFRLLSDSGVVITLESSVFLVQRRGFGGFDFVVHAAQSQSNIEYYPSEGEWPSNVRVTHNYARQLVSLR